MHCARALLILVTFFGATAAAAGSDVCLVDETNDYSFVLKRVKVPKRVGDVAVVTGSANAPNFSNDTPLYGMLLRHDADTLILGVTLHYPRCLVQGTVDDSLQGNITYDCDLDGAADGASALVVPVDCAAPLP